MKIAHFVFLIFVVSFICAYTASYAADDAILSYSAVDGKRTVNQYNGLNYHDRSAIWQDPGQLATRKMQLRLLELGYDCGKIDGVLGPRTVQAITAFQQDRRLKADGIPGPVTLQALNQRN